VTTTTEPPRSRSRSKSPRTVTWLKCFYCGCFTAYDEAVVIYPITSTLDSSCGPKEGVECRGCRDSGVGDMKSDTTLTELLEQSIEAATAKRRFKWKP
jgi:hypothetical protein